MRFLSLFFVVCVFTLQSCHETDYEHVPEYVKQWIPYIQGETIAFETSTQKDSLYVLSYQIEDIVHHGTKGDEDHSERITVELISKHAFNDTLKFVFNYIFIRISNSNSSQASIDLGYQDREHHGGWLEGNGVGKEYEHRTIDGKTYDDVISAECENCGPLSEFVMSRGRGVVAYKVNGVYWTKL
jgi:hypothetical protein